MAALFAISVCFNIFLGLLAQHYWTLANDYKQLAKRKNLTK